MDLNLQNKERQMMQQKVIADWQQIKKFCFDPFEFNIVTLTYTVSKNITVQRGCNGVTITNLGTSIVQINGITLFPSATPATVAGDSFTFGGNLGETYKGELNLVMVLPLGATPLAQITQKFYTAFE